MKIIAAFMASLSLFLVGGCSLFAEWESGRVETVARSEDRACRQRDYQWPSEAYIECRLQLYNHRNRENWERLSLSQNSPGEISAAANRSGERYKPARRDNFDCEMRPSSAGDIDYVHCAETDTARPDINP